MQKLVVLVDQPAVFTTIETTATPREDVELVHVSSEAEALDVLDERSVLMTDISSENGIDFLNAIRSEEGPRSTIPIVILTSVENERLAVQALRDIATTYVPVRFLESEVAATIDSVVSLASENQGHSRVMECVTRWHNEFILRNDRTLIRPLVRHLQESTQHMGLLCQPGEKSRLGIALEEALLNSLYHGNLEVSSELREEDESEFYGLVERRCRELPFCERQITVSVELCRAQAVYRIEDEGPGFDVACVPDPTAPNNIEKVCGRGMLLMRTFMDEVCYNEVGNEVTLVKRRQAVDSS